MSSDSSTFKREVAALVDDPHEEMDRVDVLVRDLLRDLVAELEDTCLARGVNRP